MEDLAPIPIPREQRWRTFREVYLPMLVFGALVLAILWMWTRYVQPASLIGEVEAVRADLITTVAGTLREVRVDYLQAVTNGQELAVVSALDPEQLSAELAASEADLRLMKGRMDLDRARNVATHGQARAEVLLEQFRLELARVHLVQAESELELAQKLFDARLTARGSTGLRNDFGFDVALRDRNALRSEVAAREKTVAELQSLVQRLQESGTLQVGPTDALIEQTIAAQRERLLRLQSPVVLRSPLDGFVSTVNGRVGEKVAAGRVILEVSASKSDRIVAWVREPVTFRPQVGDMVEVRRSMLGSAAFHAPIAVVGSQLEPIRRTAFWPNLSTVTELGLPFLIKSPKVLELIPGEPIQIRIASRVRNVKGN